MRDSNEFNREYVKEIMKRTNWTEKEVLRILIALRDKTFSPIDEQYYLEKISPF